MTELVTRPDSAEGSDFQARDRTNELVDQDSRPDRQKAFEASREAQSREGSYANYWNEAAQKAGDAQERQVLGNNHHRLKSAEKALFSDKATAQEACDWYLRLGSLSKLDGAEEMLVYAGRLDTGTRGKYSEAEQLLMQGSMLSEASIVNDRFGDADPDKQDQYELEAIDNFQRIVKMAKGNSRYAAEARQARVYISDITMRRAHNLALKSEMEPDQTDKAAEAKRLAGEAIKDLQATILEAQDEKIATRDPQRKQEIIGELVERAILLLLRRSAGKDSRSLASSLPYQAFPRQDYPLDGLAPNGLPRRSFDVGHAYFKLVERDGQRFVGRLDVPVQAKNRLYKEGELPDGEAVKAYAPEVTPLGNYAGQVEDIVKQVARAQGSREAAAAGGMLQQMADALVARMMRVRAERLSPRS